MRARIRREWLQKHPTPRAGDGDFHWFPAAADPALLSAIAAGVAGELTLWLEPGRVVCARRFTDVAPGDGRRYTGIAATIAEHPDATAAELLTATPVPEPAPWRDEEIAPVEAPLAEPRPMSPAAALAAVESWLPDDVRAIPRRIVLGAPSPPSPAVTSSPARRIASDPPRPAPLLLVLLALSITTNLVLALLLAGALDDGEGDPGVVPGSAPIPDAGVPAPDAAPAIPDAGVVDAAPVVDAAAPKPKPSPPRRRRK
jgi:hypothetical protein